MSDTTAKRIANLENTSFKKKQDAGSTTLFHHLHGSMGRKKSEISIDKRKLTICQWKRGSSERKTGEIVNASKSTIHNIISKYKKTKSVKNLPRTCRPRRFTEREERWIVRKITCNPKTSAVKLTLKAQQRFNKSANPGKGPEYLEKIQFSWPSS
ncbi:hypothetical protein AVEN_100796-1 [Araneus ventricosus]|uniref:Transposase Tc1-like domain-containing protein n=1 Tax=Araneus ventricosus TaxID=182803 RepID=A0A4Y2AVY0_ARAVE|nr:hypothetical protein AVEN_100796-1 [Araneus ventricosus]